MTLPGDSRNSPSWAPEGLHLVHFVGGIRIVRCWNRSAGIALLLWALIWAGMLHFLLSLGGRHPTGGQWLGFLPSIAAAYGGIAHLLNSSRLQADHRGVRTEHGPLPWPGGRTWPLDAIDGLIEDVQVKFVKGGPIRVCRLLVHTRNGRSRPLALGPGLREDQMFFVSEELRNRLDTL